MFLAESEVIVVSVRTLKQGRSRAELRLCKTSGVQFTASELRQNGALLTSARTDITLQSEVKILIKLGLKDNYQPCDGFTHSPSTQYLNILFSSKFCFKR